MMEYPFDIDVFPLYVWIICAVCAGLIIAGIVVLLCRKKRNTDLMERDGDMEVIHRVSDVDSGLDMARDTYEVYEAEKDALERAMPVGPLTHWDHVPHETETENRVENLPMQEEPEVKREASFAGFVKEDVAEPSPVVPSISDWDADQQLLLLKSHELLLTLSDGLKKLSAAKTDAVRKEKIAEMQAAMKLLDAKNEWEEYRACFEKVYPGFWSALESVSSEELTPYELRLCALLSLGMGAKETADLTNRSIRTVETTVYKIRKKLGMETEDKTQDFLMRIRQGV